MSDGNQPGGNERGFFSNLFNHGQHHHNPYPGHVGGTTPVYGGHVGGTTPVYGGHVGGTTPVYGGHVGGTSPYYPGQVGGTSPYPGQVGGTSPYYPGHVGGTAPPTGGVSGKFPNILFYFNKKKIFMYHKTTLNIYDLVCPPPGAFGGSVNVGGYPQNPGSFNPGYPGYPPNNGGGNFSPY